MEQTQTGTDIATLPVADRAMIALASTATEKHLRELVDNSKSILTVTSPDDRMEAHRAGMALKKARTTIKDTGKAAREDAQAFSKAVIAEEKRLIDMIQPEEDRVLSLRDQYDAQVAAEKAEAERIERERVTGIKTKIAGLLNLAATSYRDTAAELKATLDDLADFELTEEEFGEFVGEAAHAKATALEALKELHAKATAAEEEAARLEAERAELQRIQAEAAKRRHEEEERQRAEAERLKAEREAFEAERRAFEEQRAKAEAERQAAAELERAHEEALAMNAEFDAERLARDHEEALEINFLHGEQWTPEQLADLAKAGATPLAFNTIPSMEQAEATYEAAIAADESKIVADEVLPPVERVTFDMDFTYPGPIIIDTDELTAAGIKQLCATARTLRQLGMTNEQILVTVGEALEAIDAKEAA